MGHHACKKELRQELLFIFCKGMKCALFRIRPLQYGKVLDIMFF